MTGRKPFAMTGHRQTGSERAQAIRLDRLAAKQPSTQIRYIRVRPLARLLVRPSQEHGGPRDMEV